MSENPRERAELRTAEALAEAQLEDPRPALRERLRWLRDQAPQAYESARQHYDHVLVPALTAEHGDPVSAWLEYGIRLGELAGAGRVVAVDASGKARTLQGDPPAGQLVLHVPNDPAVAALPLAVPRALSAPQKATLELLVHRARGLD